MNWDNSFYWWIANPGINFLLSLIFSVIAFISILFFLSNLIRLSVNQKNRSRYIIGLLVSMIVVGICVRWDWFLIYIGNLSSFLVEGIGDIFMKVIYYWHFYNSNQFTNTTTMLQGLLERLLVLNFN